MTPPDRIDFTILQDGHVAVLKLDRQAQRDIPRPEGNDFKPPGFDLEAALNWCRANGYTVRQWPGGARAWLGKPWPIRTRYQIMQRRAQNSCAVNLDFAFDG